MDIDTSVLEEMGLVRTEIATYLAALELGSSTAGGIVERSGLQNAVVHRAFHSLIEKGLMTYSLEGKRKQYQAADPGRLKEILSDKQDRLSELISSLERLKAGATNAPVATIFQGLRGLRELWNVLIEKGDDLVSYGAPAISHSLLGDHFWKAHHRKRNERGIFSRHVFNSSFVWRGKQMPAESPTEVRYTEENFESLTETAVCGGKVAIFIYLDKPIGFLIDEPLAAKTYKRFFEDIWMGAKRNE